MRLSPAVGGLLALASLATVSTTRVLARDHDTSDYYVLHLDRDAEPAQVAQKLGLVHEGRLGELHDHHVFSGSKAEHDVVKREVQEMRRRKRSLGDRDILESVLFSEKQRLRKPWEKRVIPDPPADDRPLPAREQAEGPTDIGLHRQAEVAALLGINDPIFKDQWHLYNPIQLGHDVNVTDVWLQGVTGRNATVAIVDDGLDMYSDDLRDNYYAAGSYDFNDQTEEPKPRLREDNHGTRCAGEVSAVRNDVCGVGVAYDSRIAGLRILSKLISDADEAEAMNYDFQHNQIYSCSWGPPDDGRSMAAPGILIRRAMLNAVQNGRGGLGSIYVFASGNGALNDDNCNFDGYTNSIYSITVGAIDRKGGHPYYSEKCSAGLVVTYSSGAGDAIHTTDVGKDSCYSGHGGTSAAAPLAAGIFALALQVRPDLSWRDMQYLAMDTAVPINLDTGDWQDTAIGKKFSHTFSYGKIDTYALVEAAKTWQSVKPQAWFHSPWIHVNEAIPQGDNGLAVSFDVTSAMLEESNLERLEHVTVTMNVQHQRRGDLTVDLISPTRVVSHLATIRRLDTSDAGYDDWTFMSVVHWGETGLGTWTLVIKDTEVNAHNGTFIDWHLKLWGESKDASKAQLFPLPNEDDDKDHAATATVTMPGTITTMPPTTTTQSPDPISTPSDHPDRPVHAKPTGSSAVDAPGSAPTDETHQDETETETGTETGTVTETGTETGTETAPAESTTTSGSWLPSFLPTFGVSSKTQLWIYGGLGLVVLFCVGLGIYLYMARRRRLRNKSRDNYEFELLDDEEARGLNGGGEKTGPMGTAKKNRRTRGGELYDAFAAGSDDDDDDEDNDDDPEDDADFAEGSYRDHDRSPERPGSDVNEKRGVAHGAGEEEEEQHHVIGGDSDDE